MIVIYTSLNNSYDSYNSYDSVLQDKVSKVTLFGRRKQETVPEQYEVNMAEEEGQGRLVQHVEGKCPQKWEVMWSIGIDMDAISSETIQNLCTGANVFYCTLGTTRRQAGSAVSHPFFI